MREELSNEVYASKNNCHTLRSRTTVGMVLCVSSSKRSRRQGAHDPTQISESRRTDGIAIDRGASDI